VRIAAHDVGRLSRLTAGSAGLAVAAAGVLTAAFSAPPDLGPAAALVPAGIALLLQVLPAGRVVRVAAPLSALTAAVLGATALDRHPAAAIAIVLAGLGLTFLDVRVGRFRAADPLVAGSAIIALAALVPRAFSDPDPRGLMPPAVAGSLLVLALGAVLARPLETPAAEESDDPQEFESALLQSMNEAVMVLDANHRVIDVNRRWRELTGHGPDEPIRLDPPPLPPAGGDWLMPRVDGSEVPVLATVATIPDADGEPRAYVATYVDIGDRKRAEETLNAHNTELREANARLETALAFKNDLTSMLTHDMAQPISSIASLAELLRADWADLPDDIRLELATKIDKNTQRLIKMMNDLQLLFRLDTGSVTARQAPVPLLEVASQVAAADGVEIAIGDDLAALVDRGHLTVVVQNLVKNALAYGNPPVRLTGTRRGDQVELVVQDSGPGMPPELLPTIFGRFMRGAGLGLFIVRHLVEANGGTIRYEPVAPRGARFVVTLDSAPI
jgi:nitrogen-specific signal transduction histidine kinase